MMLWFWKRKVAISTPIRRKLKHSELIGSTLNFKVQSMLQFMEEFIFMYLIKQGRIMLPLNMTSDDGPTYVNAKQYHGILRRRQSRAKAVLENKFIKRSKPYMHESRHLHAMRRPRGCGGRFLNTRKSTNAKGKSGGEVNKHGVQQLHSSGSQSSDVLQSEVGTLNSSKETNGSSPNISGSEVTSMYSRGGGLDIFGVNHIGSAVHSLADMIASGHGIIMPTKWVAAASNCCNLNI